MQTLVLDNTGWPRAIVPWQRAVTLLYLGLVEEVEVYEGREIRAVSLSINTPCVVRWIGKIRATKMGLRFSRSNILQRDKWRCQYCGRKLPSEELNYDHVLPRSQGGKTEWTNVVSCCYDCNATKGARTPEQAGMRLLTKPVRPKNMPIMMIRPKAGASFPDQWRSYLYWMGQLEGEGK